MNAARSLVLKCMIAAAAATALTLGGCNIVSAGSYLLGGLPKVEAEYELEDRPTAIYVDDRANVIPSSAMTIRLAIAERIANDLMVEETVMPERMISSRDVFGVVQARDKYGDFMAIDQIAEAVGAEQIIYIQMVAFHDTPDGVTPAPTAICKVKVLDVINKARVFPASDSLEPERTVQTSLRPVDPSVFESRPARLKVYQLLAENTGESIARLFHRHVPRELGRNLNPR